MKQETILKISVILLALLVCALTVHYKLIPEYKQSIQIETWNITTYNIANYQTQTGDIHLIINNTVELINLREICGEG